MMMVKDAEERAATVMLGALNLTVAPATVSAYAMSDSVVMVP